jgi:transposase-like protein
VDAALGAGRSQRVAEGCGYRRGRKPRRLTLRTGAVQLEVPRGRLVTPDGGEREWHSQLVPRYRRSSAEVEQSVLKPLLPSVFCDDIELRPDMVENCFSSGSATAEAIASAFAPGRNTCTLIVG